MSNEWNWHVNSLQTRLSDLQSTIDSIKSCVERRPGLDAATRAMGLLVEASSQKEFSLQEFPQTLSQILADPAIASLLVGPKGDIVLYNTTAEMLLGRDFMVDKSGTPTSVQFSAEDRSRRLLLDELPWNRALKGEVLPDVRIHVGRPSVPDSWLNVSATPFRNGQGIITGAVIFLIDTTEEVQLEDSINNLCNTIHDQIAQVGSTHNQLRDLADRLSNTGIQRILADSGTAPRPEEDPTRKKSEPRRDLGLTTPAAARISLSSPKVEAPVEKEEEALPTAKVEEAPAVDPSEDEEFLPVERLIASAPAKEPPVEVKPEPTPEPAQEPTPEPAAELVEEVEAQLPPPVQETAPVAPTSALMEPPLHDVNFKLEPPDLAASGSWTAYTGEDAQIMDGTIIQESLNPALEVNRLPENTQEAKRIDVSQYEDVNPESVIEQVESFLSDAGSESADIFGKKETLPEPESEPDKAEPVVSEKSTPAVDHNDADTPAWLNDLTKKKSEPVVEQKDNGDKKSTEEGDSAKSLFGKFANLTKDSYGAESQPEEKDKEPDGALPWPELVDGENYGDPLWEEYTQSEEESTPWQQDVQEEIKEATALSAPVESAPAQDAEAGEIDFAEFDDASDDTYAPLDAASHVAKEPVQAAAPDNAYDESLYEETVETSASDSDKLDEDELAQAASAAKLKEQAARKLRPGASYNKLKPLSAAASDLEGGRLTEDHPEEQVVRYNAEEAQPVDEGPKRVLVVDDIPVNQKLLLLHLKRLGYEADVASNGQEALDMLADQNYELILMDCDMPVMSGFEAASRIRSNEAFSHSRVPIIALTSYDREGDKEKCIASGMDDYITKGASQKELKETIERSIVSARMKTDGVGSEESDSEADMAPLDITAMLKLYGREEVEEISRLFLSNMGTYIESMQLAIDEKDGEQVLHFANAVKGPCSSLGMRLMTRLTSDIMAYAETQDWTQVRVKYMRLKAVFVQTREELKKVCPDDSLLAT